MAPHTRKSLNCKLSEAIGTIRKFVPSEVPTLLAVISHGLLLQEEKLRQHTSRNCYPINQMIEELTGLVMDQWRKSDSKFVTPVTIEKRSVIKTIQRKWDGLVEAVNNE